MKLTIDGIDYIHGATHAGLDCWIPPALAESYEKRRGSGGRGAGDAALDILVAYLADPDSPRWKLDGHPHCILITDANDTRKRWPLRNTHRQIDRGGNPNSNGAHTPAPAPKMPPAPVADTYATKKTDKLPERAAGAEWPKWRLYASHSCMVRLDSMTPGNGRFYDTEGRSDVPHREWWDADHEACGRLVSPTEAAQWLRANGHAAEADRIEPRHPSAGQANAVKARVFAYQRNQWVGVIIGSECYGKWPDLVWARTSTPIEVGAYTEITSTPEANAILADLASKVPAAAAILNAKG